MSQRKQVLMRTCRKCKQPLATTAKGIKDHAEACTGQLPKVERILKLKEPFEQGAYTIA